MLFPKKVKYRKWQRLRGKETKKTESRGTILSFGAFGLKAAEGGLIKSNQIESARKVLARFLEKGGKMWIRIFPDHPFTAKPPEVGMGKGKGDVQGYLAVARAGKILFEIDGVPEQEAKRALKEVGAKLPLKTKIVLR